MRITVVGSADAFNADGRGHSCYWLDGAGSEPLMVDFGGTALAGLKRLGREPDELGAIVLTHLHADHFAGLPFLHVDLTFRARRTRPLLVVGPRGTRERVGRLLDVAYGATIVDKAAYRLDVREMEPGEQVDVLGARVAAHAAEHLDAPDQALCLRVTGRDGSVVAFSGDTQPCPGLLAAADGADLLVAECTATAPPAGRHCTLEDWRGLLPRVGARRVVFTHLGEGVRAALSDPRAGGLSGVGGPPASAADDGMVLDVSRATAPG